MQASERCSGEIYAPVCPFRFILLRDVSAMFLNTQNLDKIALGTMLAAARYARRDESKRASQPLPANRSSQLLSKCVGASSQDHPGEASGARSGSLRESRRRGACWAVLGTWR